MIPAGRKKKFLQELAECGIISVAAKRVGIDRSTAYAWKKNKPDFAKKFDDILDMGRGNWCDFAENQLHSLIKDRSLGAIKFLLENNDRRYRKPRPPDIVKEKREINNITYQVIDPDEARIVAELKRKYNIPELDEFDIHGIRIDPMGAEERLKRSDPDYKPISPKPGPQPKDNPPLS